MFVHNFLPIKTSSEFKSPHQLLSNTVIVNTNPRTRVYKALKKPKKGKCHKIFPSVFIYLINANLLDLKYNVLPPQS